MSVISSGDNPRVKRWRELTRDARTRRKQRRALIEGEHLIVAFLDSGAKVQELLLSKSKAAGFNALAARCARAPIVLADSVFRTIADSETPAGIAAEISVAPFAAGLRTVETCVFLDAVQDAGNVGTILRSAAAFGVGHVVLGKGCADAWSSKVLRAAAGAHFSLRIAENADLGEAIADFGGRVACTVPRGGVAVSEADLKGRIGWLFGAEGQGVSDALAARAALKVTIPMPGGAESLNVAAAAAICFYQASLR